MRVRFPLGTVETVMKIVSLPLFSYRIAISVTNLSAKQGSLTISLGYEEPDEMDYSLATLMMNIVNDEKVKDLNEEFARLLSEKKMRKKRQQER